jgi:hypothetical protein
MDLAEKEPAITPVSAIAGSVISGYRFFSFRFMYDATARSRSRHAAVK